MRRLKKLSSLMLSLVLMLAMMTFTVSAETEQAVLDARDGVVFVQVTMKNGDVGTGSGFLIGEEGESPTTVVTNAHVIGDENNVDNIYIIVNRDIKIAASVRHISQSTDYAILELAQPLKKTPLKLLESGNVDATDKVYALGYPAVVGAAEDDAKYTAENVSVMPGELSNTQSTFNNIVYYQHNAVLSAGNSGGPLVTKDGYVIAINTFGIGETDNDVKYYYSLQIDELTATLKTLGLKWEAANGTTTPVVTGDDDNTISEEPTTTPTITKAPEPVKNSSEDADEESEDDNTMIIIIACAGGAVVLVIIIVIIVVIAGGKKKKNAQQQSSNGGYSSLPNNNMNQGGYNNADRSQQSPNQGGGYAGGDPGATTVLGGGVAETSVLGGGGAMGNASLVRVKDGSRVQIMSQRFRIGKDASRVEYCIPDNSAVSRLHCEIISRNGEYFIVDNNSKNFTYVDGRRIMSNTETRLTHGTRIKVADEEFEFKLM